MHSSQSETYDRSFNNNKIDKGQKKRKQLVLSNIHVNLHNKRSAEMEQTYVDMAHDYKIDNSNGPVVKKGGSGLDLRKQKQLMNKTIESSPHKNNFVGESSSRGVAETAAYTASKKGQTPLQVGRKTLPTEDMSMVSDYMQAVPQSTNVYKNGQSFEGPDLGVGIAMGNYSGNKGIK